jgi:hypothetical protein
MTEEPRPVSCEPRASIHVDRDGRWDWEGHPMVHEKILLYLKRHLDRDRDGRYWVGVGQNKVEVVVDDAPFVVEAFVDGVAPRLRLDDGREEPLTTPLRLLTTGENRLYIPVKEARHRALLSRTAHQQVWSGLDQDGDRQLWLRLGAHRLPVTLETI